MEPVPIGSYRGFAMSLTVENFGKDFVLTLKGRMSHRVELGKDARGNLVRIDNALAQMPERYKTVQGAFTLRIWRIYSKIRSGYGRRQAVSFPGLPPSNKGVYIPCGAACCEVSRPFFFVPVILAIWSIFLYPVLTIQNEWRKKRCAFF